MFTSKVASVWASPAHPPLGKGHIFQSMSHRIAQVGFFFKKKLLSHNDVYFSSHVITSSAAWFCVAIIGYFLSLAIVGP